LSKEKGTHRIVRSYLCYQIWLERRFWNRTFVEAEKSENLEEDIRLMRQLLDEDEPETREES